MSIPVKMKKNIRFGLIFFLLISLLACGGDAALVSVQNVTLSGSGSVGTSALVLDSAPDGIAGFRMNVTLITPGVALLTAVDFPSAFSGMKNNSTFPSENVMVVSVDLAKSVEAGAADVALCTFTLAGVSNGSSVALVTIGELTDDNGNPIHATVMDGVVTVGSTAQDPIKNPEPTPSPAPEEKPAITPTPSPEAADFIAAPCSGPAPLSVGFSPNVSGTVSSYIWSFGDGTSSDLSNPTHIYETGTYDVTLLVQYASGGSASVLKPGYITVDKKRATPATEKTRTPTPTPTPVPLIANFTAEPVTGNPPLSVQFTDLSEGSPTKWRWNFGDGTLSTMQNPLHVYGGIGRYTVTLEVSNRYYSSEIVRKTEFIKTKK